MSQTRVQGIQIKEKKIEDILLETVNIHHDIRSDAIQIALKAAEALNIYIDVDSLFDIVAANAEIDNITQCAYSVIVLKNGMVIKSRLCIDSKDTSISISSIDSGEVKFYV